ncbi:uncharacterized protein LOC105210442 [Zeugodacus cucurbitae]|uniref:Polypeptide N-acetylgalactosaminyltransferase 6 n=1 Tax=Zeugodacus cucurbitae TaxID=28588 RepID=A0A0A1XB61_ZEUCU|nr:uncharacterized protein LOC105210442 [Zeugodacus cucurbitae]XP_054085020.1 uncharacterized protein LOC105210442 [Zeugodacus cucurbitae]
MALSLFRTLLLVVATNGLAHAHHVPASTVVNFVVTSSLPTIGVARNESSYQHYNNNTDSNNNATSILGANAEYPSQTALNLEDNGNGDAFTVNISTPKSVVQDWSLVCQQLCGAGLGGAPCLAYCHSSDKPSLLPAFNGSRQEICKDLCRLQLGDVSCNCTPEVIAPIAYSNMTIQYELGNAVCGSFCEHSNATLIGCSSCQLKGNKMQIAKRAAAESTTPDWKELCASLCKTGDGGALCNCDLAPFF